MYETPADDRDQGISNPDLVEKRKDIKVSEVHLRCNY